MILRAVVFIFLFFGLVSQGHGTSVKLQSAKLLDVLVGDDPRFGEIYLVNTFNGDKILWRPISVSEGKPPFVELRIDPKTLNGKKIRDFEGIGFSNKHDFFSLEYRSAKLVLEANDKTLSIVDAAPSTKKIKFTRPEAPWTKYKDKLKAAEYYTDAVERDGLLRFPVTSDISDLLTSLEPKGPKKVIGFHSNSTRAANLGLSNWIIVAPVGDSAGVAKLNLILATGDKTEVFEGHQNGAGDPVFQVGINKMIFGLESMNKLVMSPVRTSSFNSSHVVHSSPYVDISVSVTTQVQGQDTDASFMTGVLDSEDVTHILNNREPLTDSDVHPFISMVKVCGRIIEAL